MIEVIFVEDRVKDIKDFDFEYEEFFFERVLGIEWCVENDIRRGIFLIVS